MKVTCSGCNELVDSAPCFQVYDILEGKASYLCSFSCVIQYEANTRRQA